jgi:hypothetical protein
VIIANEKIMLWLPLPGCLNLNTPASLFLRTLPGTNRTHGNLLLPYCPAILSIHVKSGTSESRFLRNRTKPHHQMSAWRY